MYETFSALVGKLGAPYARKLAVVSMRATGCLADASPPSSLRRSVMGLSFPSPLGLAAGCDKNGNLYPVLPGLGFGFGEIGSVTPQPEAGRSPGLAAVVFRLAHYRAPRPIPLGVSVSMNRATPLERIPQDYLACLEAVWAHADYVTLNLGVRAGPDLHMREHRALLHKVLHTVKIAQGRLAAAQGHRVPIAVKLDQSRGDTASLSACIREYGFDGLVLSGAGKGPAAQKPAELARLAGTLQDEMPIISVGGILTPQDALDRLDAGADLLQIYTGLVKFGPRLVQRINHALMRAGR